ncbi:MAG TPA: hypothetical protein VGI08_05170 [Diaminobutyricibacter sp.]
MLTALRARRRPLLGIAGAVIVLAALAGCSTSVSHPVDDYKGEPKGVVPPASSAGGAAYAVWLKSGAQFAIVLYGSSTCPPTVATVESIASNQLKATPAPISDGVCTRDYAPHTTVFTTPRSVTTTSDVTIKLPDSTLTLPGIRG